MCNERNHSTCYTVTTYELHFQEQQKKKTNQHNQSKSKNFAFLKSVLSSPCGNTGPFTRDHIKSSQMRNETPLQL